MILAGFFVRWLTNATSIEIIPTSAARTIIPAAIPPPTAADMVVVPSEAFSTGSAKIK